MVRRYFFERCNLVRFGALWCLWCALVRFAWCALVRFGALWCVLVYIYTIYNKMYARRTRSFSVARMRSSNSARMNKLDFTTEKIGSVHMTVFEIVAYRNVDNWTQLLK